MKCEEFTNGMFKVGNKIIVNKICVFEDEKLYRGLKGRIIRNIDTYYKIKFCKAAENFIREYNAKNDVNWSLTPYIWAGSIKKDNEFIGENE